MPARRCDIGCESWPDDPIFTTCTYCGEQTRRVRNATPTVEFEEARSIKLHELFDLFYERRCEAKGIPSEGPMPAEDPMDLYTLGPIG